MQVTIREQYEIFGVENYYKTHALEYINPHLEIITKLLETQQNKLKGKKILDLCCGTGEVTNIIEGFNKDIYDGFNIKGLDPFTNEVYTKNTGKECYTYTFKDIGVGKLTEKFDVVICSFALHLCEKSLLYNVLWNLSGITDTLIVITPNKRPDCNKSGWVLKEEIIIERVRLRTYKNNLQR